MVRHEARLRAKEQDGAARRDHLERAAARGVDAARKALEGPEFPEPLRYLYGWLMEVHGRSGVDMSGLSPLTYATIADWAVLMHRRPRPHDVEALLTLDAVLRFPDAGEEP